MDLSVAKIFFTLLPVLVVFTPACIVRCEDIQTDSILLKSRSLRELADNIPASHTGIGPRRVAILWCGTKEFTLVHYLSITSAINAVKPSAVIFAYQEYPNKESLAYNTWLQDLEHSFPFWEGRKLSLHDEACQQTENFSLSAVTSFVTRNKLYRCLILSGDVIFADNLFTQVKEDHWVEGYSDNGHGFVYFPAIENLQLNGSKMSCPVAKLAGSLNTSCFVLDTGTLIPEQFVYLESEVSGRLRELLYGSKVVPLPRKNNSTVAPNIAHYVWLGRSRMHFTFFMSVLSALYLGRVDTVYVHGDRSLTGIYWTRLQGFASSQVVFMLWEKPGKVFGQDIKTIEHKADVIKSRIMLDYGGILMDPDICFIRPPDPDLFTYDTVVSPDLILNTMNMGISISKPHSEFAKLWIVSEQNFVDSNWLWNRGVQTYKLWERRPWIAKLSPTLQLFCYKGQCYPLWISRGAFYDADTDLMSKALDWRKKAVAIHFVNPDPYYSFMHTAFEQEGLVGEFGREILRASGLLGKDEGLKP